MSPTERVLLVEDDEDIRDIIQEVLTAEGFRVDVAKDGVDALDKLEGRTEPPVILLDMMMPRMDGETFLRILRGTPAMAEAPVVVVSGNASARERARRLQATACLVKPFELDELLGLVRRFARGGPALTPRP